MQTLVQRLPARNAIAEISDEEIVARVLSGEKELYEVIMRRYNQRLFRISRGYVRDEGEAEEIMQEAYVKAYEALPRFRRESRFSTWLTRILINEALACVNRRHRVLSIPAHEDEGAHLRPGDVLQSPDADNPAQRTMNNELRNILEGAIDGLPEKYRAVYIMRELEEMSTAETSECLKISEINVKVRLSRARALLRRSIDEVYRESGALQLHLSRCDHIVASVLSRIQPYA